MITENEFNNLINEGEDSRLAPIKAILDYGENLLTKGEKEMAITTFQKFLFSHPDYEFETAREKAAHSSGYNDQAAEAEMWSIVQPILDKAQGL